MNLAVLHYHLNRGGVTRVIANQLLALDAQLDPAEPWRVALIYGGRREDWCEELPGRLKALRLSLHEAPLLDYDAVHGVRGRRLVDRLDEQVSGLLGEIGFVPDETVLHVHNHSLGKNRAVPAVVLRLAGAGFALLLEIHDFAEDFRPANYRRMCHGRPPRPWTSWPEALYPQAPHVHYAVLNGRDRAVLRAAGTREERLHLLPNPVLPVGPMPAWEEARHRLAEQFAVGPRDRYVLYPVRCIRRKNLGEAVFLGAMAAAGNVFGLTLAPLNPAELPVYQAWKKTAEDLRLPCLFEVGGPGRLSFAENLAAADAVLTTSLAEGFGMVFLETWLAGLPLVGRDLPEITADYRAAGLRYDWLLPRLSIPVEWIGAERFLRTMVRAYRRTLAAYGRTEPTDLNDALESKTAGGLVDFGDLDEALQQQVIQAAARSDANRRRVLECNPGLEAMLSLRMEDARPAIQHNAEAVAEHFSLGPAGRRLVEVYRRLASSPRGRSPQPLAKPGEILDRFLDLRRFRTIRA